MKVAWPWVLIAGAVLLGLSLLMLLRPAAAPDNQALHESSYSSSREPSPYQQAFDQRMAARRQADAELSDRLYREQMGLLKREKLFRTPECQFWWQQDDLRSTRRTRAKKQEYCDS